MVDTEIDNDEKGYITYLNIPSEVMGNNNLNRSVDPYLFALIRMKDGKNGCYASNAWFAQKLNVTTKTISVSISNLKKEGYIKEVEGSFNGRRRVIKICNYQKIHKEYLILFNEPLQQGNPSYNTSVNADDTNVYNKRIENKNRVNKLFPKGNNKVSSDTSSIITSENTSLITLKKRKNIIPKKVTPTIPNDVKEVFNYWQELGLRMPKEDTKSYKECIKKVRGLLSGTLFSKKYPIDIIKEVICKYSFVALDPQFEPSNLIYKKKLSKNTIADFILNEFNRNGNGSLFKQYLKEDPKTLKQFTPVEDKYPAVSNLIKKTYQKKILGNVRTELTSSDENCFRLASNKLMAFFDNNEDKIVLNLNNSDKVDLLFESILKTVNENKVTITPAWLCSSTTINQRLPSYCFKQSVLQEEQRWSIYDKSEKEDDILTIDYDE